MTVGTILLQLVIWLPLLGAVVIAFFGNDDAPRSVWRLAVGFTAVTFVPFCSSARISSNGAITLIS